ncbi:GNAT family N-acetyltransferase [Streptomyces sp. NBC_00190]|uniref:GNAT family N-acetyltransferase n=1 Tax=unclassified Streptomyces TaxID=2593676 RepID=UPI002E2B3F9F|nr:GNAT family N-acetyltransferase [Streptomyces sp. NBC_00190]WSZ38626.1 GNAT family N-acetyltransferase [Streptomyces sp. NBC_00868]
MTRLTLRDRIEHYYAHVPLLFAEAEEFGTLRLFVRREVGAPYYGGPSHARPVSADGARAVTVADLERVRARQRELGVPQAFEWLAESAESAGPGLRATVEGAGIAVEERPLMVLDPERTPAAAPLPAGVTVRAVAADDPALAAVLAVPNLAFGGPASVPAAEVPAVRQTLRDGTKVLVVAFAPDGSPLAAGHYHPCGGAAEIGGIGTHPAARRQGLGAAVTTALTAHAADHGVRTVFLAYALESVARLYARLGFRPAGTTLLIAGQPARGQRP